MTTTRRRRLPAAVSVGCAAALVACSTTLVACSAGHTAGPAGHTATSAGSGPDRNLAVGLTLEPPSLDFTRNDGAAIPQVLLDNVYDGLVRLDSDGTVVPDLATSWTVSPDRRTYTFVLRSGATFSNGHAFTAADAVFSIDRVKSKAWTISLKSAMDVVSAARALSPTSLQVTLARPSNDWLYRMTTRVGAMFTPTGVGALATTPVGTGPYRLQRWNRGTSIVLTRSTSYWGRRPFFDTVTLDYFKDPNALNNALLTGTINLIGTVTAPESLAQFTSNPAYRVVQGTTNGEVVLSFNNGAGPLKDRTLREAVRYGIDHRALLDTCWAGRGQLIGSMVPPTDPWYQDLTGLYPHDAAKAKALLAGRSVTLRLRVPDLPYATACGQVVKSQLEQVGFHVRLDTLEFPQWVTQVFTDADYDMSIVSHVEPRDIGAVFGNPAYYTRYRNPEFEQLVVAADAGTAAEQVSDLRSAARLLSQDAAADWLFLSPNLLVADRNLTGVPRNAVSESFDLSALART